MTTSHAAFSAFPTLRTKRLVLRKLSPEDVAAIFEIYRHPEVMEYYLDAPHTSIDSAHALLHYFTMMYRNKTLIWWGVTRQNSSMLIGMLGLYRIRFSTGTAETGFDLHPKHWGNGIMSEALQTVLHYGFDVLRLHEVTANTLPGNMRSQKLLTRMGFVRGDDLPPGHPENPMPIAVQHFELSRKDFNGE